MFVIVASFFAVVISYSISGGVADIIRKASHIEEYEKELRNKWGVNVI
jgi:hypothetical protein